MSLGVQQYRVTPQLQSESSSPGIHDCGCHGQDSHALCIENIFVRPTIQITTFYSELSLLLHSRQESIILRAKLL